MISLALLLLLWHGLHLSHAFDPNQVNLTSPEATIGVAMTLELVKQIQRSYQEACFVYTHGIEGVSRQLQAFEGVTSGVAHSDRIPFNPDLAGKLTYKSKCSIYVMPVPDNERDLLDYDHALWNVSSPTKVLLFLQEDGYPNHGLNFTRLIPAINTTFTHILLRRVPKLNQRTIGSREQMEMYCLSIDPAVKIFSFEQCRDISENLSDITMTVSHITAVPTAFPGPNGGMTGSDVSLLNMLKKKYGFEYKLRSEKYVDAPNNSTPGQIIRVSSGAVDLGIGGALQTNERLQQVEFLVYLYIQDMTFITPIPKPFSIFYTLVLPFDGRTWGLIAVSSISLVIFFQLSDFTWKKFFYADAVSKIDTLYHHSVIVFSSLIGYELPHKWLWHRLIYAKSILLAVTFFSGFFLNMDYKSTLRANLYTEIYSTAIDTAEQIYHSGLPVYIQNGSLQMSLLRTSPRPIFQKLYNYTLAKNTLYTVNAKGNPIWLDQMIDRGEAIFIYYTMAMGSRNGTYHISSEVLYKSISSFFVPKCSTLPNTFNLDILWLNAAGIPLRLFKHFLGGKASHSTTKGNSKFTIKTTDDPLNIEQVLLIFIILAGGLIVATLAFTYEVYKSWEQYKSDRTLSFIQRVDDFINEL